jgi:hypothetical protein
MRSNILTEGKIEIFKKLLFPLGQYIGPISKAQIFLERTDQPTTQTQT